MGGISSVSFAAMEFKEAEITTLKNLVEHDPGSGSAPAKVSEKIGEKSKVTTAAASMAELTFADTSITRLGANSLFSFQSKERLIKLDKGSILVNTPPGNGGATVDCGGVTGAVSGTTFMASRDGAGNVMFVMLEGSGVLKVTINTPGGAVSREIRPGQAATVGGSSAKLAAETGDTPGGGADAKPATPAADAGDAGEKPAAKAAAPTIQVFDVDVRKIVETAPLIREFKAELPSMEKIEKTIEKQQAAVKEGKLEKLEVEVVAVKEDGDVLVGAPKVDPQDMKIVNRKEAPDAGLDIDTAAGGEPRNPQTAASPFRAEATVGPNPPPPPTGNVAGITATEAGGLQELPPTQMTLVAKEDSLTVTLDRRVLRDRTVTFNGFPGLPETAVIPTGSDSVTVPLVSANLFPGFTSDTDPSLQVFSLNAVSGNLTASTSSSGLFPPALLEAANPVRALPQLPNNGLDLAAMDSFFYFRNQVAGVTAGPSSFFDPASVLTLQDISVGATQPVELRLGQDFVLHAAHRVVPGTGGDAMNFPATTGRTAVVIFGTEISLGGAGAWTGLDWVGGIPPAGSLNLGTQDKQNPYFFVYNQDLTKGPVGYFDAGNDLYEAPLKFPVWNDDGGFLAGATSLKFDPLTPPVGSGVQGSLILAAGKNGLAATGLKLDLQAGHLELLSAGVVDLKAVQVSGTGAGEASGPEDQKTTLLVDAKDTVKLGGAADTEQVRFEGATVDTAAGIPPAPGSLAVIRSEKALELRNLTIRSFDGTRLEKTGANSGRILVSGSTVRDFKIKELTGMAVNADAKIQMMAVNDQGQLDGVMKVEGSLPVATKLASAIDSGLTGDLGNKAVHARDIDLAARRLELNNATLTAMNSLTARANTLIIQNSFMTVVRGTGMINFYVGEGRVNPEWNTTVANQLNFYGSSTFQFGNHSFTIASSGDIASALTSGQMIETTTPQAGKVNVMPLGL